MEPEARYSLVGGAIIVLALALAAVIVWLHGDGQGTHTNTYRIYFERQSLEGLELRSHVTMRGVRVGAVTAVKLSSQRPGAVEVLIGVDPDVPVRQSTLATVERHMVTGLASVRLANLSEDSPYLSESSSADGYPVIAEGESHNDRMSDNVTQLTQRADEAMRNINALLAPENRAALAATLENLRKVTAGMQGTLARADRALESLGKAGEEVRALAQTVAAESRTVLSRYGDLGSETTAAMRELQTATRQLSTDVNRLARRTEILLNDTDEEVRATARALKNAAESVDTVASRLRDPQQILSGPTRESLGPGEAGR